MISKIKIKKFRTIQEAELDFRKINVLIGANNSGKSSVLYSLYALKNSIQKTSESIDGIYNLPNVNLGGFREVVHKQDENNQIQFLIESELGESKVAFSLWNTNKGNSYQLNTSGKYFINDAVTAGLKDNHLDIKVSFPHSFNKMQPWKGNDKQMEFRLEGNWNGRDAEIHVSRHDGDLLPDHVHRKIELELSALFQSHVHELAGVDLVPINRTFTKNQFQGVPLGEEITSEEEVISYLFRDERLQEKLSIYLQKIASRKIEILPIAAGLTTYLAKISQEQESFKTDLVNEGTGTNQLVRMLFKILIPKNSFICIDEPEIHMHPTMIGKLVDQLVDIVNHQEKQLLFSTHSEHFITSLLANVSEGKIKPEDVMVYYLQNINGETVFEHQKINEMGQIEGGLQSFYVEPFKNFERIFKL